MSRFADFMDLDNQKVVDINEAIDLYGGQGDIYREHVTGDNVGFETEKGAPVFVARIKFTVHVQRNKNKSDGTLGTYMKNEYVGTTTYNDVRRGDLIVSGAMAYTVTEVDNSEKNISHLRLTI